VGDSVGPIILDSPYHVLLLIYKPDCGGCIQAKPVFQRIASLLAGDSNVIVAQMDKTRNDFPTVSIDEPLC
jgi:thiol-disulfide isomerase/thioredoxin